MSIRNIQLANLANEIASGFLTSGKIPTINNVIAGIYGALGTRATGTPFANFTPLKAGTTFNSATQATSNDAFQDIENLYADNIDLVNRIVRDYDYKQTQRNRVAQLIVDTTASLEQALAKEQNIFQGLIGSCFNIDLNNTTAYTNFQDFDIELQPSTNQVVKVDLMQAALQYTTSDTATVLGNINTITDDTVNSAFIVSITSSQTSASMTISMAINSTQTVSKVVITGIMGSPVTIDLNINGQNLSTRIMDVTSRASWEFTPIQPQQVTFTFSKLEPDYIANGTNRFDFGVQNVSIYLESYVASGVFQSLPIKFAKQINSVTLTDDTVIPPNCSIDWEYTTNVANPQFIPIVPGGTVAFATASVIDSKRAYPVRSPRAQANVMYTTSSTGSTIGAADVSLSVNSTIVGSRTPLFNLCTVNNSVQPGNTTIRRGKNAWLVYSYHYSTEQAGVIQNPNPTINDFYQPRGTNPVIYTRYQPTEFDLANQYPGLTTVLASALRLPALEYPYQSEQDAVMHLFEATLIVDSTLAPSILASLNAATVTLPNIFSNGQGSIYCNGQLLSVGTTSFGGSLQYSVVLPLQAGVNTIQIVTNNYVVMGGQAFDIGTQLFSQLCVPSGKIIWYADAGPMTEVPLFELQYQTSRNDFTRFAIADDPNGLDQLVVIRELPTTVYDITTSGIDIPDLPSKIIVRATLNGSPVQPCITPKINGYTLTVT